MLAADAVRAWLRIGSVDDDEEAEEDEEAGSLTFTVNSTNPAYQQTEAEPVESDKSSNLEE